MEQITLTLMKKPFSSVMLLEHLILKQVIILEGEFQII